MVRSLSVLVATCATVAAVVQGGVAAAGVAGGGRVPLTRPLPVGRLPIVRLPVARLTAADVTATALRLEWQWPSWAVTSVTVRMATGIGTPAAWQAIATVTRTGPSAADSLRVAGLKPLTKYVFSVAAGSGTGGYAGRAELTVTTAALPLRIAGDQGKPGSQGEQDRLPDAIRGLYYLDVLKASGGVAPYTWSATARPAGLRLTPGGALTGYPLAMGPQPVTVQVRDARGMTARTTLRLAVPTSLPSACVARSCALLSADARTIAVPAADLAAVTRLAGTGPVVRVVIRGGEPVRAGDVLVLPAGRPLPSGLIVAADAVAVADGTTTIAVRAVSPAAAYDQGTVQTMIPPVSASPATAAPTTSAPATTVPATTVPATTVPATTVPASAPNALACGAGVTSHLHGLSVVPALTPAIAAHWVHQPYAGPGGYAGPAGLRFFQLTLAGTITVDLGVSVSAAAKCALTLPPVERTVPVGGLGAVRLTLQPALSLATTGELDVATAVTLTCYASYRVDEGATASGGYCTAADRPLEFSALGAATATATASITASAALDDLPVLTGSITTSLKAAYAPAGPPTATVGATAGYALATPLGGLWAGAAGAAAVHGTPFSRVLTRLHGLPPGATGAAAITVTPTVAYPWSDSVCGFTRPGFGAAAFTVAGTGFLPGERAGVETGWLASPVRASANSDGSFTASSTVGEVPSVLDQLFSVGASGSAGSSAGGTIELDANGCVLQRDLAGRLAVQWGGNGFDPGSALSLSVDGVAVSHATANALGSGGVMVTFACPAAGSYTWQITGIVNELPVDAASSVGCAPRAEHPLGVEIGGEQASAAPATPVGGRQPWRVPPARLPVPAT
jgi:hypothetical protein